VSSIIGIDPSTKTGIGFFSSSLDCALHYDTMVIKSHHDSKTRTNEMHRVNHIADRVLEVVKTNNPELVIVENFSYANKFTSFVGVEINTLIQHRLFNAGIGFILVAPTTLKKFVTGKGNANKDVMRLEAYKRWEIEAKTDDEIDAVCLAMFGAAYLHLISMPELHMSVFKDNAVNIIKK
jgi:Holliday junction resolvasome RuvABC endonuclease subunit